MGDKVKKYIDSRFRTSGTPTDFQINLIDDIECSQDQVVYVNAVSFPNTIYTVQTTNNKLYVLESEYNAGADSYTNYARVLTIPEGNYSGLSLEAALTTALAVNRPLSSTLTVAYVPTEGAIKITMSGNDRIWLPSSEELMDPTWRAANWDGATVPASHTASYSTTTPNSIGDVMRISGPTTYVSVFKSGLLDLRVNHVLYLHSSLTSYQSLTSRGERTAIARIPINADFGYVVHWANNALSDDYMAVGSQRFRTLRFRLTNAYGTTVDLHGGHISLKLIFAETK